MVMRMEEGQICFSSFPLNYLACKNREIGRVQGHSLYLYSYLSPMSKLLQYLFDNKANLRTFSSLVTFKWCWLDRQSIRIKLVGCLSSRDRNAGKLPRTSMRLRWAEVETALRIHHGRHLRQRLQVPSITSLPLEGLGVNLCRFGKSSLRSWKDKRQLDKNRASCSVSRRRFSLWGGTRRFSR